MGVMLVARHSRKWDIDVFRRYNREGRGQGVGAAYKPWITVRDFPSLGMVSRIKGQTSGRVYHLMSNNETNLFYILDWSDDVLDIREQYPLSDLTDAIGIAESARIRYPYDFNSGFPYVMTSDFYVETTKGTIAIAVKTTTELAKPRVLEKLEIERRYWLKRGVDWKLITEREINADKARNIEWLSQAKDLAEFGLNEDTQNGCIKFFRDEYVSSEIKPLTALLAATEQRFGLTTGIGLNVYKHLGYWKHIYINVEQPINVNLLTYGLAATAA